MNFNTWWNQNNDIDWKQTKDPQESARRIAEKAFHKATVLERHRCIQAVQSVQEDGDIDQSAFEYATQDKEHFGASVKAMIQMTKDAAVKAIKSFSVVKH